MSDDERRAMFDAAKYTTSCNHIVGTGALKRQDLLEAGDAGKSQLNLLTQVYSVPNIKTYIDKNKT